jgi:hypothetical protein
MTILPVPVPRDGPMGRWTLSRASESSPVKKVTKESGHSITIAKINSAFLPLTRDRADSRCVIALFSTLDIACL